MKIKLTLFSLLLAAATSPAFADLNAPSTCPSPEALKTFTGTGAFQTDRGWSVNVEGTFESRTWHVNLWFVDAKDENEAIAKSKQMVSELTTVQGPYLRGWCATPPIWHCDYQGTNGLKAIARTSYKIK